MPSDRSIAERVMSGVLLVVLIAIVGYFAAEAIPKAQRPTLLQRTTISVQPPVSSP